MSERAFRLLMLDYRQWLLDERGLAAKTRKDYSERVAQLDRILARDGRRITTCTRVQLRAAYTQLPATPSSRNGTRSALLAFYRFLQASGSRPDNPAEALPYLRRPRYLPRPYDRAQAAAYWSAAERISGRELVVAAFGLRQGLRIHETAKVQWSDVSVDELRVRGKGGKDRVVPLAEATRVALEKWRADCESADWIFPSRSRAGHLTTVWIEQLHHHVLEEAGLRTLQKGRDGYHRLRHTFATEALDAGDGNVLAVRDLLGHASVATTQIYALVRPTKLAPIIQRMYQPRE